MLKKRQAPYKFLVNYKVLRLFGHLSSLGAESGFPAISISLQQHVVPLICMGTVLCMACVFKSKEPEGLQVSKAKSVMGRDVAGRRQSRQHFDRVLPAVCSPLPSALNPNKSHIEKIQ